MKNFKIRTSIATLIALLFLWSSCKKEESNQSVINEVSKEKLSGAIPDDPIKLSKVPVIISSDYLVNGRKFSENNEITFAARGGKADRTLPTISITSPTNGATVSGTTNITVSAKDNVGVVSVSLSVDGALVGSSNTSPFTNIWNSGTVSNGTHTLSLTAKDAAGNQATSSIQVTVYNVAPGDITAPTVNISSPANGAAFEASTLVNINTNASDNIAVTSLSISIDGTIVASGTVSSLTYAWNTASAASGLHSINVKATDQAGNIGTKTITVTVNTTTITPPTLPSSIRLSMPTALNQGGEGSCVAFTVNYARSFEQYNRTNSTVYSTSTNIFSPEFVFNQTKSDAYCSGSALLTALDLLVSKGTCTWASMPYSSTGCTTLPTSTQLTEAVNFKITSYSKILKTDQTAIKTMLASKRALVAQITIDDNFRNAGIGYIWNSFSTNAGLHALVICGYDDNKGAFLALNSWGTTYGDAGYIWIGYNFLQTVSSDLFVMNF